MPELSVARVGDRVAGAPPSGRQQRPGERRARGAVVLQRDAGAVDDHRRERVAAVGGRAAAGDVAAAGDLPAQLAGHEPVIGADAAGRPDLAERDVERMPARLAAARAADRLAGVVDHLRAPVVALVGERRVGIVTALVAGLAEAPAREADDLGPGRGVEGPLRAGEPLRHGAVDRARTRHEAVGAARVALVPAADLAGVLRVEAGRRVGEAVVAPVRTGRVAAHDVVRPRLRARGHDRGSRGRESQSDDDPHPCHPSPSHNFADARRVTR